MWETTRPISTAADRVSWSWVPEPCFPLSGKDISIFPTGPFSIQPFDVRSAADFEEIKAIIRSYSARDQGVKVLFGFGHSRHAHAEKRLITRSELDDAEKERPLYLVCYDGRSAVANTAAIGMLPPAIRSLRGFDLETGQLFHEAFYEATDYISGKLPATRLFKYILKGMDTLSEYGVGLIHTVEGIGYPRDLDVDLVRFAAKGAQGNFRIYFQTMDTDKVLKRGLPRIGGCFCLCP
jgi:predicted amidohydrolase YtcJ